MFWGNNRKEYRWIVVVGLKVELGIYDRQYRDGYFVAAVVWRLRIGGDDGKVQLVVLDRRLSGGVIEAWEKGGVVAILRLTFFLGIWLKEEYERKEWVATSIGDTRWWEKS